MIIYLVCQKNVQVHNIQNKLHIRRGTLYQKPQGFYKLELPLHVSCIIGYLQIIYTSRPTQDTKQND